MSGNLTYNGVVQAGNIFCGGTVSGGGVVVKSIGRVGFSCVRSGAQYDITFNSAHPGGDGFYTMTSSAWAATNNEYAHTIVERAGGSSTTTRIRTVRVSDNTDMATYFCFVIYE